MNVTANGVQKGLLLAVSSWDRICAPSHFVQPQKELKSQQSLFAGLNWWGGGEVLGVGEKNCLVPAAV